MDLCSAALKLNSLQASDWTVVVAGVSIVIGTLVLLIIVFSIFGSLVSKAESKAREKAKSKLESKDFPVGIPTAPVVQSNPAPVVENGISGEIVAAISAAVYSMEGEGAVVKSITAVRKKSPVSSRNPWAQAAVTDNTRPF